MSNVDQEKSEAFLRKIAAQTPEAPDYWSTCGQCQHNSEEAQDLLEEAAKLHEYKPKKGDQKTVSGIVWTCTDPDIDRWVSQGGGCNGAVHVASGEDRTKFLIDHLRNQARLLWAEDPVGRGSHALNEAAAWIEAASTPNLSDSMTRAASYAGFKEGEALTEIPADCDVRKILLKIVPGFDGEGVEIYAENVKDVEDVLSDMGLRLEDYELAEYPRRLREKEREIAALEAKIDELRNDLAAAKEDARTAWARHDMANRISAQLQDGASKK